MKSVIALFLSLLLFHFPKAIGDQASQSTVSNRLVYSEQVFDFGHVGIDFKLFHTFYIVNNGDHPVPIKNASTSCDCSHISYTEAVIDPGDTAFFHLDFLTRNFYGPTTKSVTVELDDSEYPQIKFYYLSTIGQWFGNLKPQPFSLFFLPGSGPKNVTLNNRVFDEISWEVVDRGETTFSIEVAQPKAKQGESLSIAVTPKENLEAGTYLSSFTVRVTTAADQKPVLLTIPVKIVKY